MKKISLIIILIIGTAMLLPAQYGDARTRGMGNAFTAVADDVNAIFFNPAGLAYLNEGTFSIDVNGGAVLSNRLVNGESEFPWVDEYSMYDEDSDGYWDVKVWDDFLRTNVEFDPADYGFDYDPEDPDSYNQAIEDYVDFVNYYSTYEGFQSMSDIQSHPRIAYARQYFGAALIANNYLELIPSDYAGEDTVFEFISTRESGGVVAGGFNLGIVALGANLKYYTTYVDTLTYDGGDFEEGPTEGFLTDVFMGPADSTNDGYPNIELGIGAMMAFKALSVGAYLDNLLYFMDFSKENPLEDADVLGIFNTMTVGAAWTPFNVKSEDDRGILNLIVAADLRNFGDSDERTFNAGTEIGLNLGDFITADMRFGFKQALPGSLINAIRNIDPRNGDYTVGVGGKFWFARMDMTYEVPGETLMNWPVYGSMTDEELDREFGKVTVSASFAF